MPYIKPEDRFELKTGIKTITTPGELNYCITSDILIGEATKESIREQIDTYLSSKDSVRYEDLNAVLGVVAAVIGERCRRDLKSSAVELRDFAIWLGKIANEFYDEVVAPYEDKKIEENGDLEEWKLFERFRSW
jgi:hypothetical protein